MYEYPQLVAFFQDIFDDKNVWPYPEDLAAAVAKNIRELVSALVYDGLIAIPKELLESNADPT